MAKRTGVDYYYTQDNPQMGEFLKTNKDLIKLAGEYRKIKAEIAKLTDAEVVDTKKVQELQKKHENVLKKFEKYELNKLKTAKSYREQLSDQLSAATELKKEMGGIVQKAEEAYINAVKQGKSEAKIVTLKNQYNEALERSAKANAEAEKQARKFNELQDAEYAAAHKYADKKKAAQDKLSRAKQKEQELSKKSIQDQAAAVVLERELADLEEQKSNASEEDKKRLEEEIALTKEKLDTAKEIAAVSADELEKATKDRKTAQRETSLLGEAAREQMAILDGYMDTFSQYQSRITTRMMGTGKSFTSMYGKMALNMGVTPLTKQTTYLEKLDSLVASGISYNIEQRAFLASVADKIATTFDVANGTLLRLVRLQQADTTQARMGMEAALTQFFNNTFQDSSFLGAIAEGVSDSILEASSLMEKKTSAEFEYTVKKWLGSLTAVGVSSGAVNTIAQGLGYLGSGDISNLSGSAMETLFAMAASKSGKVSYADMLVNGLDSNKTNLLLESLTAYLSGVATEPNNVVKSQFAKIFGLNVSDLRAFANLGSSDISMLAGKNMTYNQMMSKTQTNLLTSITRMHMSEMLSNVMDNTKFSMAATIASNPATYALYKVTQMIGKSSESGGINIPFINAMGFGLDLNSTVNDIMSMAVMGVGALGAMGQMLTGLTSLGGANLSLWDFDETTKRGTGYIGITGGAFQGSSGLTVMSRSGTDMQNTTLKQASDSAREQNEITNGTNGHENDRTTEDLCKALFDNPRQSILVEFDTSKTLNVALADITKQGETRIESTYATLGKVMIAAMMGKSATNSIGSDDEEVNMMTVLKKINDILGDSPDAFPVESKDNGFNLKNPNF